MKSLRICVIFIALLMAALAMTPLVSAAGHNAKQTTLGSVQPMGYFVSAGFCANADGAYTVQYIDESSGFPIITSYYWNFGDGSTSTAENPTHTYAPGTYTVSHTVTSWFGSDTDTVQNFVTVYSDGTLSMPVC